MSSADIYLKPSDRARSSAHANRHFAAGAVLLSVDAWATVVLDLEKGSRCDECLTRNTSNRPRRCTGCAHYYYCNDQCQSKQWKKHHKRMCKHVNAFMASNPYQALSKHEKLEAFLLSHVIARMASTSSAKLQDPTSQYQIFVSLLPGPILDVPNIPTCPVDGSDLTSSQISFLYSRFGNNNFTIHSHLNGIANGVFAQASRYFNHSCSPNAAARYKFSVGHDPQMEVVCLREIDKDEEICISYLDPALTQSRHQVFQYTYGFTCQCPSCKSIQGLGSIPEPTLDAIPELKGILMNFLPPFDNIDGSLNTPFEVTTSFPDDLRSVLHENFLTVLSEAFSNASHDGPHTEALQLGLVILSLYRLLYPVNFPQIGMHLLEMAKVAWAQCVQDSAETWQPLARQYLRSAKNVLLVYGPEGDSGGPYDEISTLQDLLE